MDKPNTEEKALNPLTKEPLSPEGAEYVQKIREACRGARRAARSGNPAKRVPALTVLRAAPRILAALYRKEANR